MTDLMKRVGTHSDNMKQAAEKGRLYWQKALARAAEYEAAFTHEDVELLREAAIVGRDVTDGPDPDFWNLADRIEALLPPEPTP